ncbi:MAG: hypothetical protein IKH84_03635, partial [Ottowia sp.]|nr:hypothetical protein [Ottowia sp.]
TPSQCPTDKSLVWDNTQGVTDEEKCLFLKAFNELRANANPAPNPPPGEFQWHDTLAAQAYQYALAAVTQPGDGDGAGQFLTQLPKGENTATTIGAIVKNWATPEKLPSGTGNYVYNYASNTCSTPYDPSQNVPNSCEVLKQVYWRDTQYVGCGHATKNSNKIVRCYLTPAKPQGVTGQPY